MSADEGAPPWERRPGESAQVYAQFCAYRDRGPRRTLAAAAQAEGKSYGRIRNLASQWAWAERARAWDAENERIYRLEFAEQRRAAARLDAALLQNLMAKLGRAVQALDPEKMSGAEFARLLDVGMRHRRALFGDPIGRLALTGADGGPVAVEVAAFTALPAPARAARLSELAAEAQRRADALTEAAVLPDDPFADIPSAG